MSVTSSAIQDPISKIVSYKGLTGCHRRSGIPRSNSPDTWYVAAQSDRRVGTGSPCPVRLWDSVLPSVIVQAGHMACQSCEVLVEPVQGVARGSKNSLAMAEAAYLLIALDRNTPAAV